MRPGPHIYQITRPNRVNRLLNGASPKLLGSSIYQSVQQSRVCCSSLLPYAPIGNVGPSLRPCIGSPPSEAGAIWVLRGLPSSYISVLVPNRPLILVCYRGFPKEDPLAARDVPDTLVDVQLPKPPDPELSLAPHKAELPSAVARPKALYKA